jgi:hypothetical protein
MARQMNLPVVPPSKVDSPNGGDTGVLFLDSVSGKLSLRLPNGDLAIAELDGTDIIFVVK